MDQHHQNILPIFLVHCWTASLHRETLSLSILQLGWVRSLSINQTCKSKHPQDLFSTALNCLSMNCQSSWPLKRVSDLAGLEQSNQQLLILTMWNPWCNSKASWLIKVLVGWIPIGSKSCCKCQSGSFAG